MKMVTSSTTRMVLNKEERAIQQSWKQVWSLMKREEGKYGYFVILFGDWSGYTSSQSRITHIDFLPHHDAERMRLQVIKYTDGTTMNIWIKKMTLKEVIETKTIRKLGYTSLLAKAIATGESFYKV